MKLIMENWRNYLEQPETTSYLIYESGGQLQRVDFDNLLLELDNGKITDQQVHLIFEQAFDYGMKQLLEEGVLDVLKKIPGVEKIKDLKSQAGKKIKAAFDKVNNFLLKMVKMAAKLAVKGVVQFAKALNTIFHRLDDFKKKHPILYKIVLAILFALLIFAIFGASTAKAAVAVGAVTLDDQTYFALQGALNAVGSDPDIAMEVGKAQVYLKQAFESGSPVQIDTLGPWVNGALDEVVNVMGKIKGGSEDHLNLFSQWIEVGKSLRFGG